MNGFWNWIRWRFKLSRARGHMFSYFECGMGYTPGADEATELVHILENVGVSRGWMKNADRKVRDE